MKKIYLLLTAFLLLISVNHALFAQQMPNGNFEYGNTNGWSIYNGYYPIGGDSGSGISTGASVTSSDKSEGMYALKLIISGSSNACGTAHGPLATSPSVNVVAGERIALDWKANDGGDDYDVYAWIVRVSDGAMTQVLYERGDSKPWTTAAFNSPYTGAVQFRFLCGTQDATCGTVVGAVMYIDNIRLMAPDAPVATAATSYTATSFVANWTYNNLSPITHYLLDVSTDPNFGSFVAGYEGLNVGNVNTFNVTGLNTGLIYYYRVRAVGTLVSAYSNVINTQPAPPVQSSLSAVTATGATINWNAVENGTKYYYDVAYDANFTEFVAGYENKNVTTNTATVSGLDATLPYWIRVRSSNDLSTSENSNVIIKKGTPYIYWPNPHFIIYGTLLSEIQLNAVAKTSRIPNLAGTYKYNPAMSALLPTGSNNLGVTFYPNESAYYNSTTGTSQIIVIVPAPTVQAFNIAAQDVEGYGLKRITGTTFTIDWERGNGNKCAVFVRQDISGLVAAEVGVQYSANSKFKAGTEVNGTGWYCVYNGTETSVKVTGLKPSTEYKIMVLEYNEQFNLPNYNLSSASLNPIVIETLAPLEDNNMMASNYISPNSDGLNDVWVIQRAEELYDYQLNIFNNIGETIYESMGYDNTWPATYDDKELPSGTYYYIFSKGKEYIKGFITIVRENE